MNIKHILFTALTAVCTVQTAVAVPAYPRPITVTQADGTKLTILLRGDERSHLTLSEDGYPLIFNEQTLNYEYATLRNNQAEGSGIVAQAPAQRSATVKTFLQSLDVNTLREAATVHTQLATAPANPTLRRGPQRILTNNFPHTGEQHTLVMLIQFSDEQFTVVGDDAKAFYNGELNEEGFTHANGANGSARDYFLKSSCGVFQPTFDVVGPITVSGTRTQYSRNYGMGQTGDNAGTLLKEAVELIDSEIDFSQYDHDGDGYVDNIYFYYAGYGYADSNKNNTIWPHAYSLPEWGLECLTDDGVRIGSYTCSNEIDGTRPTLPAGIGTFVHEFGHCLGFADHYDANNNGGLQSYNLSEWDVMASGSYNNHSNTPPAYSAFERGELGWMDYTELSTSADSLISLPRLTESNKAYIVRVPDTDEYFLLENRQQEGWDEYLPGHGMLVWHVDMNEAAWWNNTVNVTSTHQMLDIVEADGRTNYCPYPTAAFPGTKNVTQFTFNAWNGDELFAFDDVTESEDSVIRFVLAGSDIKLASPAPVTISNIADSTFTAQWTAVQNASGYVVSVTTPDGTPTAGYTALHLTETELTVSDLTPETTYTVSVRAALGNHRSDEAIATATTTAIPFEKLYVSSLTARDITDRGFTADWSEIAGAQTYEVTLCHRSYNDEVTSQTYGFDNGLAGMPELWETNSSTMQSSTGYYGEKAPALRFNTDGQYLKIAYPESKLSSLSFWTRGSQASSNSQIVVERYADGQWLNVDARYCSNADTTLSFTFEPSDSVRVRFAKQLGYMTIDDISVGCHELIRTPLAAYNGRNMGDVLTADFTDLEANSEYGLTVRGICNGTQSHQSPELIVATLVADGISNVASDGTVQAVYDLQGRRIAEGQQPSGICIVRQNGKTYKKAK